MKVWRRVRHFGRWVVAVEADYYGLTIYGVGIILDIGEPKRHLGKLRLVLQLGPVSVEGEIWRRPATTERGGEWKRS